ncbi:WAS/WASL-interacting protein family member 3-like [Moschus berezovskii]|uniref:WAS/WASL-interacting protein family member 3-like n=1 Tax=Moschus berezovskii TaxID=68408 RepID=UPI0024441B09|nr:WAS/WASL-interacting protein family member 3-like [Moschus berezovskii]
MRLLGGRKDRRTTVRVLAVAPSGEQGRPGRERGLVPTQQPKETEQSSWRPRVRIFPPWPGSHSSPGARRRRRRRRCCFYATGSRSLCLEVKHSPPGSDAHFPPPPPPPPPVPSLRGKGLGSLSPAQPLGFREEEEENRGSGRSVPAATARGRPRGGRAGPRESGSSLVGGRRGSLNSRSASAGQTSSPALRGRRLRIGRAGGLDEEGGGRGGACGRRRWWPRRAPPAGPASLQLRTPALSASRCRAPEQHLAAGPPEQPSQPAPPAAARSTSRGNQQRCINSLYTERLRIL